MKKLSIALLFISIAPIAYTGNLGEISPLAKQLKNNDFAIKLLKEKQFSPPDIYDARNGLEKYFNNQKLTENQAKSLSQIVKKHLINELLQTILDSCDHEELFIVINLFEDIFKENIYEYSAKNPDFYIDFTDKLMNSPAHEGLRDLSNNNLRQHFWFFHTATNLIDEYGNPTKNTINSDSIVSLIKPSLKEIKNFPILKRLLDFKLQNPQKENTLNKINCITSLLRGEIALFIEYDADLALELFLSIETDENFINALIKRRIGELYFGHYYNFLLAKTSKSPEFLDWEKGFRTLSEARKMSDRGNEKNQIALCLAKFYLNLSCWPCNPNEENEKKAFALLGEVLHNNNNIDHHFQTYKFRLQIEYFLYISNTEDNLERARELIKKIPKDIKKQHSISILLGEIAMQKEFGERDVKSAIKYYSNAKIFSMLYEIYSGMYGEEFSDSKKAQESLEHGLDIGLPHCVLHKAIELFKEGLHEKAIKLLNGPKFDQCLYQYYKGRFLSYKNSSIYNPDKAMDYFYKVVECVENYKDSSEQIMKIIRQEYGDGRFVFDHIKLIKNHIKKKSTLSEIKAALEAIKNDENIVEANSDTSENFSISKNNGGEIHDIENKETPIILLNNDIETFMTKMGFLQQVKASKIRDIMNDCRKYLGAEFSMSKGNNKGQLSFPGVDSPFNFHLSIFKSNKIYKWNGHYLGQLRNIINERYRVMYEESISQ